MTDAGSERQAAGNPLLGLLATLKGNPERIDEFLPQLTALEEELLIQSARGEGVEAVADFGEFVFGFRPAAHHRLWIEKWLSNNRIAQQSPPESAKTTWATIFVAWWIGKHPETTNAIGSAGDDAAEDMARVVADTIEFNSRWKRVFPNVVPNKERGWSNDGYNVRDASFTVEEWSEKNAGMRDNTLTAGGVGSVRFNGIRVTGVLLLDDIHDRRSQTSETICKQVVDFVKDTAEPRVTRDGKMLINQTRWSPKDVIGWARDLKRKDGSRIFEIFFQKAILEDGSSYWPEERPLDGLEDKRAILGEILFLLVYQGEENAMQGQVLKKEALRYFPAPGILHTWQHYGGVDFAQKLQELTLKQEQRHSRFAYAMLAHTGSVLVLVDGFAGLISMGEAESQFYTFSDIWRPVRVGIEVNAQNRAYYNNLIRRKIEQGYAWLNLIPINTSANMGYRMAEMEPDFRLGAIQVSDAALPFLRDFEAEWLSFGTKGARNDTLSAAHLARQAAYYLLPVANVEQTREREKTNKSASPFKAIEHFYRVGSR